MPLYVFVSSKMRELAAEREALMKLLPELGGDQVSMQTWVFEDSAPASNASIREVYLNALRESSLYIGLFWNEYGEWTIDEFEHATAWGIERHIYVKDVDAEQRDPRLQTFLDRQSDVRFGLTPRWFRTVEELKEQVTRSIERWLLDRQIAHHISTTAILADIADDVPEQPRKLIGRDDLVDEVQDLLADNERVLLRGFGGMGKTALAASCAAEYIESGKGQVLWIKAGAAGEDALFEAIARSLGEQQSIVGLAGEERIQQIRHLLAAHKGLLLVLDDTWNGSALASVVRALPRRAPLLVTSRQRFPLDEIIEVGQLKPDQALKLLSYHARRKDFSEDPDAERLCALLGYHAFALEIASKTLKVYDISPDELLQRIQDTPHDLSMPANFGELDRTGIKPLLDASVNELDRDQLDVFVAIGGLYEPGATPELLALVMQRERDTVQRLLDELELRGLVNAQTVQSIPYYRAHDLAYSYSRTMFVSKGLSRQPVIDACRVYTCTYKDDLNALDAEQSSLLEAAEAAYRLGQEDVLSDIMWQLTVDGPYFAARGHTSNSLELLKLAVKAARDHPETAHYLLSKLGNTYIDFLGDLPAALQAYEEALKLAEALYDPRRQAILRAVIGKTRFLQNAADADRYYETAEQIARESQDDYALSFVLHHRGYYMTQRQPNPDHEAGWRLSDEAAAIAARYELHDLHFHSLINRGGSEYELGRIQDALATHLEAHNLAQTQNNHPWMASALQSLGEDYHALEDHARAQQSFDEALTLWRQAGGKAQARTLIDFMESRGYTVKPE
jgi:tetratricopeptide (TPR) repeat protein